MERRLVRSVILFLTLVCACLMVEYATADDHEDPYLPTSLISGVSVGFGSVVVKAPDIGGDPVDVWETLEPALTVYMTSAGEPDLSPSEYLIVGVQPVSDVCIASQDTE